MSWRWPLPDNACSLRVNRTARFREVHLELRAIILTAAMLLPALQSRADPIPPVTVASNMQIIGHSDLTGAGKGGEGLALGQYPNGQRVLFLAHESAPMCVSVIDVTHPEDPKVITQLPVEANFARCNSLGLSGTTLAVASPKNV